MVLYQVALSFHQLHFRFVQYRDPYGSSSIQVEEYKRPRFEISFEPFRDLAVIGDSITVKANATTLTGMPLADARVEWKVKSSSLIWRSYTLRWRPDCQWQCKDLG